MRDGTALLLLTRSGFETDLAQEVAEKFATQMLNCLLEQVPGVLMLKPKVDQGDTKQTNVIKQLWDGLSDWRADLIFAREVLCVLQELKQLKAGERLQAIAQAIKQLQLTQAIAAIHVYAPDADAMRSLAPIATALQPKLTAQFVSPQVAPAIGLNISPQAAPAIGQSKSTATNTSHGLQLHVLFLATDHCAIALADRRKSAPVAGGIARLKFPPAAPSRSTLKLDEALMHLLSERERQDYLQRGMRAVDLGACPGGWTYQLVRRGIKVIAVDNGAMDAALMRSGFVEHVRADGFRFVPNKPVDWMVCDMVDQPIKVAELAIHWLRAGHCKFAVVNFKLPMKKRLLELQRCKQLMQDRSGGRLLMRCKQLYHDREEVTAFLTLMSVKPGLGKSTKTQPCKQEVKHERPNRR